MWLRSWLTSVSYHQSASASLPKTKHNLLLLLFWLLEGAWFTKVEQRVGVGGVFSADLTTTGCPCPEQLFRDTTGGGRLSRFDFTPTKTRNKNSWPPNRSRILFIRTPQGAQCRSKCQLRCWFCQLHHHILTNNCGWILSGRGKAETFCTAQISLVSN